MTTNWLVRPSRLAGSLKIPSSKSQTMRALLFGLLAQGVSTIDSLLLSPDTEYMLKACRLLGADVVRDKERVVIRGLGGLIRGATDVIDAGNSGLIYRFMAALGALSSYPLIITGDESIRKRRPIVPLLEALTQLGVEAYSLPPEGGAPIYVRGPLTPRKVTIEGSDSQPVSALLVASAFAPGPTEIFVENPQEKPWVALTLSWFDRLGIVYEASHFEHYRLQGRSQIPGFTYTVPGDFSTLAFPLAAALVTQSPLVIENLDFHDPQGDKKLIALLQQMGARLEIGESRLEVKPGGELRGGRFEIGECIDALPILSVLGCFAKGSTEIVGARGAKTKECNRIEAMVTELKKMGAQIEALPDGVRVHHSSLRGASLSSWEDHRVAMSLAVAGMGAQGESLVEKTGCVDKTFAGFVDQMQNLGASFSCI